MKFKKSKWTKWVVGVGLWVLGFVLMNVESSYSASCSREAALKRALRSVKEVNGTSELRSYGFDHDEIRMGFRDGSNAVLELHPKTCEILEIRVDRR